LIQAFFCLHSKLTDSTLPARLLTDIEQLSPGAHSAISLFKHSTTDFPERQTGHPLLVTDIFKLTSTIANSSGRNSFVLFSVEVVAVVDVVVVEEVLVVVAVLEVVEDIEVVVAVDVVVVVEVLVGVEVDEAVEVVEDVDVVEVVVAVDVVVLVEVVEVLFVVEKVVDVEFLFFV